MEAENKKLDFPKETPEKAEPSAMEEGDTAVPEEEHADFRAQFVFDGNPFQTVVNGNG